MALSDEHVFSLLHRNFEDEEELPLWQLGDYLKLPTEYIIQLIREDKFPKPIKIKINYVDSKSGLQKNRSVKRWRSEDILAWQADLHLEKCGENAARFFDF